MPEDPDRSQPSRTTSTTPRQLQRQNQAKPIEQQAVGTPVLESVVEGAGTVQRLEGSIQTVLKTLEVPEATQDTITMLEKYFVPDGSWAERLVGSGDMNKKVHCPRSTLLADQQEKCCSTLSGTDEEKN